MILIKEKFNSLSPIQDEEEQNYINLQHNSENTSIRDLEMRDTKEENIFGLEQCVICLNDYESDDQVRRPRCGHVFHAACIEEWFERSSACPLCKDDLSNEYSI
eukprot:UN03260